MRTLHSSVNHASSSVRSVCVTLHCVTVKKRWLPSPSPSPTPTQTFLSQQQRLLGFLPPIMHSTTFVAFLVRIIVYCKLLSRKPRSKPDDRGYLSSDVLGFHPSYPSLVQPRLPLFQSAHFQRMSKNFYCQYRSLCQMLTNVQMRWDGLCCCRDELRLFEGIYKESNKWLPISIPRLPIRSTHARHRAGKFPASPL